MSGTILDRDRVYALLKLLMIILLAAIAITIILAAIPNLAGADESYVVLSDSMSPSIKAGAVVFVSDVPTSSIKEGDVITFQVDRGTDAPVTHRVVDVRTEGEQRAFVTKGDANEDPDDSPVPSGAVVGLVAFHIPLIGYVVSFANSQLGLLTLIVIPALLLVVLELRDFWQATANDEDDCSEGDELL